jgi:hypothetical protein
MEVSGQLHAPAALPLGKEPPVSIGQEAGWVSKAGLDDMEKRKFLALPGPKLRTLGHPAGSQSIYRLCHPSSLDGRIKLKLISKKQNVRVWTRFIWLRIGTSGMFL